MSTEQTWQTVSSSLDDTVALARSLGERLRGGEVIELVSDLGGGKTAFVRGLVQGAGSADRVSSPSFTLNNVYETAQLQLHHFDFYRLQDPGIMRDELAEILTDGRNVVIVEWAGIVEDILPPQRLTIRIRATDESKRELTYTYPTPLGYLIEGGENT